MILILVSEGFAQRYYHLCFRVGNCFGIVSVTVSSKYSYFPKIVSKSISDLSSFNISENYT